MIDKVINSDELANQCIKRSRAVAYGLLDTLDRRLYYHGKPHTLELVVPVMRMLCRMQNLPPKERAMQTMAADWHDVGFTQTYWGNEPIAADLLSEWMRNSCYEFSDADIEYTANGILNTNLKSLPQTPIERNIRDADFAYLSTSQEIFLRIERNLLREIRAQRPAPEQIMWRKAQNDGEWNRFSLAFIVRHQWFTNQAADLYTAQKTRNVNAFIARYKLQAEALELGWHL